MGYSTRYGYADGADFINPYNNKTFVLEMKTSNDNYVLNNYSGAIYAIGM